MHSASRFKICTEWHPTPINYLHKTTWNVQQWDIYQWSKDGLASLCDLAIKAHYIALVPFCQSGTPASDTCSYQTYCLDSVIVTCILNHIPTPFAQSKHSAQSPYQCKVMANHSSIGCIPVHTCPAVTYMRVSRCMAIVWRLCSSLPLWCPSSPSLMSTWHIMLYRRSSCFCYRMHTHI